MNYLGFAQVAPPEHSNGPCSRCLVAKREIPARRCARPQFAIIPLAVRADMAVTAIVVGYGKGCFT
jgi:hypothetical protein